MTYPPNPYPPGPPPGGSLPARRSHPFRAPHVALAVIVALAVAIAVVFAFTARTIVTDATPGLPSSKPGLSLELMTCANYTLPHSSSPIRSRPWTSATR